MADWAAGPARPAVSIICHTYNHEAFLRDTLNGFLMQETRFPFEILIHDDASTDGTGAIISEYRQRFPNLINVIAQPENIHSRGLRPIQFTYPRARGKYVALCEGDDYWLDPNKLQLQYDQLEASPGTVLSFHSAVVVDEAGRYLHTNRPASARFSREELKRSPFIPTLTRFFEKRDLPWLQEQRLPIAHDVALVSQLGQFGAAAVNTEVAPAVYRHHTAGVWSLQSETRKARISVDAFLFLAERYAEQGDLETCRHFQRQSVAVLSEATGPLGAAKVLYGLVTGKLTTAIKSRLLRLLALFRHRR